MCGGIGGFFLLIAICYCWKKKTRSSHNVSPHCDTPQNLDTSVRGNLSLPTLIRQYAETGPCPPAYPGYTAPPYPAPAQPAPTQPAPAYQDAIHPPYQPPPPPGGNFNFTLGQPGDGGPFPPGGPMPSGWAGPGANEPPPPSYNAAVKYWGSWRNSQSVIQPESAYSFTEECSQEGLVLRFISF